MAGNKKVVSNQDRISVLEAAGAAIRGLRQMGATPGQKAATKRRKKRLTLTPKVTRERLKKAGNP